MKISRRTFLLGGVTLYQCNYVSPAQLMALLGRLQQAARYRFGSSRSSAPILPLFFAEPGAAKA